MGGRLNQMMVSVVLRSLRCALYLATKSEDEEKDSDRVEAMQTWELEKKIGLYVDDEEGLIQTLAKMKKNQRKKKKKKFAKTQKGKTRGRCRKSD